MIGKSIPPLLGIQSILIYLLSSALGSGRAYAYVFLAIGFGLAIYCRLIKKHNYKIEYSIVIMLAIFLLYVVARWGMAGSGINEIKALLIGSDGGMLYAVILGGVFMQLVNSYVYHRPYLRRTNVFIMMFFIVVNLTLLAWLAKYYTGMTRSDILLVSNPEASYQRSGIYLALFSLCFFYVLFSFRGNSNKKAIEYCIVLAALLVFLFVIYISQVLGSNAGAAVGLLLIIVSMCSLVVTRGQNKRLVAVFKNRINILKSPFIFRVSVVSLSLLIVALLSGESILLSFFGIEVDRLRMFAYGEGLQATFESRFDILIENIGIHFHFSPLWGHPFVDRLTTGEGTYIHSLISIWTHLGLVGCLFFILLVALVTRALIFHDRRSVEKEASQSVITMLYIRLLVVSGILILALLISFFTWLPLWFVLGMAMMQPYTGKITYA